MKDEIALITGATGSIGSATSRYFADEGIEVLVTDIDDEKGRKLVDEILDKGGKAEYHHMDVCSTDSVKGVMGYLDRKFGRLNYLINIAGGAEGEAYKSIEEIPEEVFDRAIDLNLKGVFRTMKHAVPLMKHRKSCIVNTSSGNALQAVGNPCYTAAKGGLIAMGRYFADNLGRRYGIRINTVIPGTIPGHRTGTMYGEKVLLREREQLSVKDFGKPEDIAYAIYFLTQEEYANGTELVIDGGQSIGRYIV